MEFVTFEIAKKLIEKGFDIPVSIYTPNPTISQVFKWLRDENNIHVEIYTNASGYNYIISDTPNIGGTDRYFSDHEGPNDGGCWDSYEKSALAGIKHVLENLI